MPESSNVPNIKNNVAAQETCRKLVDAAGEVFAKRGLYAATIKEITDLAGVNTAAINYHFRDKFELYAAVVHHALSLLSSIEETDDQAQTPERRLEAFIRNVISDLYDPLRPNWCAIIVAHELAQPTEALTSVVEELIRPRADILEEIARTFLGPHASHQQVVMTSISVASQCFHYLYHSEVIRRLHPNLFEPDQQENIVAHILEFSLSAMRSMRRRLARSQSAK